MRKFATPLIIVLALLLVAGGIGAAVVWQRIHDPYKGFTDAEQFIDVTAGTGTSAIGRMLVDAGIIRDEFTFRAALWWTGRSRTLQAGEYRFDRAASAVDVIGRLARGDVYARPLTFPEGLTIDEMSRLFEMRGFGSGSSFVAAARDGSLIKDLDPAASDLEGYLFPGDVRAHARHIGAASRQVDDRSLSSDLHRRSAATRSGPGTDHAPDRLAGIARWKRKPASPRSGRSLRPSTGID